MTLTGQVVARLRQAILDGTFPPGDRLSERRLTELFDVSRSVIREAVQQVSAEGLITIVPHRGPMVSVLDPEEARQLYRVRAALEGLAAAEFAQHATDAARADLRRVAERLAQLSEDDDTATLIDVKNEFYAALLDGCGNAVAAQMLTQLNNRIITLRRLSLSQPGRLPKSIAELSELVAALEARDADRAKALAEAHVATAAAIAHARFAELETQRAEPDAP